VAGSCECGLEPSASIECGEFLCEAENFLAFRKDSAPCNWLVIYEDIF